MIKHDTLYHDIKNNFVSGCKSVVNKKTNVYELINVEYIKNIKYF